MAERKDERTRDVPSQESIEEKRRDRDFPLGYSEDIRKGSIVRNTLPPPPPPRDKK